MRWAQETTVGDWKQSGGKWHGKKFRKVRQGITVVFSQGGVVGRMSVHMFVIHLAAVITLLGLADEITEKVAKYVCKYEDAIATEHKSEDGKNVLQLGLPAEKEDTESVVNELELNEIE